MVYARGVDVQIDGISCNGTSFASPEVARVLDFIWSRNPALTSAQLLTAFDLVVDNLGTGRVLPQDENGFTSLAFINQLVTLVEAVAPAPTPTLAPTQAPLFAPRPVLDQEQTLAQLLVDVKAAMATLVSLHLEGEMVVKATREADAVLLSMQIEGDGAIKGNNQILSTMDVNTTVLHRHTDLRRAGGAGR